MRNKKKMIILAIQILAVIIFVMSYKSYTDTVMKPINVYMWAREIGENIQIKESDIIVGKVSSTDYTANMILTSDAKSIIGSYTTSKVYPDTYIYYKQIGEANVTAADFANLDLTNARVISIPCSVANDAGADFSEGDKIDLIFTANGSATIVNPQTENGEQAGNSNTSDSSSFTYSKFFMQDVTIYKTLTSSGYKTTKRADRFSGEQISGVDTAEDVQADSGGISTLLIIVTPEQAEEIKAREKTGDITIAKRFEQSETHETLGYVMGNYGKVFAGNANAETGSLQIVSTIQDTDTNTNNGDGAAMLQNKSNVVADGSLNGTTSSDTANTDAEQSGQVRAAIGTQDVE